jgi:predicted ester cyclase
MDCPAFYFFGLPEQRRGTMASSEQNKAVVQRYFEEVYNEGKYALIHDLFHTDFTDYSQHPGKGASLAKHMVDFERSVFPDIHITIEDMMADGDDVIVRLTIRGTHGGTYQGITPTGRRAEFLGVQRMRFEEGRIASVVWHHFDKLMMLQQLGALDMPPQEE